LSSRWSSAFQSSLIASITGHPPIWLSASR